MTQNDIQKALRQDLTVPVWPTAGRALGLSRNSAYEAVKRGEIPSLRIGSAIRVPTAALRQMLGLEPKSAA